MKTNRLLAAISGMFVFLTACSPTPPTATPQPTAAAQEAARYFTLADISDEPAETIELFQPLADYLAAGLSEFGITAGQVKAAADLDTMTKWMQDGEVDLYFDSVYPVMIISDAAGAKPILRRWKDGVEEYHTVIFARGDSNIKTLEDLKGHIIALEDNFSTSAYMLPLAYLAEAGLKFSEKADPEAEVDADEVGYVFSGDDENTVQWILSGKVVAGAVNSETYLGIPDNNRKDMVVLSETESLPRHLAVVRGDLDPNMVAKVTTLLTGLDKTDEGKALLQSFEETAKFDEFPDGADTALKRMRELFNLVQGKVA